MSNPHSRNSIEKIESALASGAKKPKEDSHATKLVKLAQRSYKFGIDPEGKPFAYTDSAPHVALGLRGRQLGLRQRLSRDFYRRYHSAPSDSAVKNALTVLEGIAMEQTPTTLHLRVAGNADAIYLDMADPENRLIEISDGTWKYTDHCPYKFRRTELSKPMIDPGKSGRSGRLASLWNHVNIDKQDQPLLLAVLIDNLIQPNTPKPVTGLLAEHGSAKSTTAKRMVQLIDASTVELRSPPKDLEQWITAASGSWVVALDNLSHIPEWLSDAICRASTYDGNVKRALFTDGDLSVVKFRRSVIITGIDVGGMNGDLADRLVPIELRPVHNRLAENDLEAQWQRDSSDILAKILTNAAKIHHKLPTLETTDLPRMADFGRVLATMDSEFDCNGIARYAERSKHMMADSALSNSFVSLIVERGELVESKTAAQILLDYPATGEKPIDWPKRSRAVTTLLNKHAPALRQLGWQVSHDDGKNKHNVAKWTLKPPGEKNGKRKSGV